MELRGIVADQARNASGDGRCWKKLIGDKPVDARLATLPENKIRPSAFAISSSAQLALTLALISLPLFFPEHLLVKMIYQVTPVAAPQTEIPLRPEQPITHARSKPIAVQPVEPVHVAKLFAPQPLIAPRVKVSEPRNSEIPKFEPVLAPTKLDTSLAEPERPREPVKTGVLNSGSAAPPELRTTAEKVQTGGFGDPHGFASDTPDVKHGNVARVGSFELPSGPGYGNGTAGANGARGAVASAGFGNGVAVPAPTSGIHGVVQSGGFGSVQISAAAKPAPKQGDEAAAIQAVVILSKPSPLYTDEARKLGIEGEVQVSVIFRASGQVETVRIVKGLGHGLDEAALHAAAQIRFKAAVQEGHAVDFPAIVHIVFQLAF